MLVCKTPFPPNVVHVVNVTKVNARAVQQDVEGDAQARQSAIREVLQRKKLICHYALPVIVMMIMLMMIPITVMMLMLINKHTELDVFLILQSTNYMRGPNQKNKKKRRKKKSNAHKRLNIIRTGRCTSKHLHQTKTIFDVQFRKQKQIARNVYTHTRCKRKEERKKT